MLVEWGGLSEKDMMEIETFLPAHCRLSSKVFWNFISLNCSTAICCHRRKGVGKGSCSKPRDTKYIYKWKVGIPLLTSLTFLHDFTGLETEKIIQWWSSQFDCRAANFLRSAGPMWRTSGKERPPGNTATMTGKWGLDKWYIGMPMDAMG